MHQTVKREHVIRAIRWAMGQEEIGIDRTYDQSTWDCGTSCCIWGAAHLIATGQPPFGRPASDDLGDDEASRLAVCAMCSADSSPQEILDILEGRSQVWGMRDRLTGDVGGIRGDASNIRGDVTGLRGDVNQPH